MISTSAGPRWVGNYLGVVLQTDENEPRNEHLGRLKVRVPLIHGPNVKAEQIPWAFPCFPSGGKNCGFIDIPPVDSTVLICFEGGDINAPIWMGSYFPMGKFPSRAKYSNGYRYPKVKLWRTSGGQMVRMVDNELVEIYAGKNDTETVDPETGEVTTQEGDHGEWETYVKMDLKRHRMTIRSKYPLDIRSDGKIKVKGIDVEVIAAVEADNSGKPINDLNGNDADGSPVYSNHRGSKLTLRCMDSTGNTAASLGLGSSETGFQDKTDADGNKTISPISVSSQIRMTPKEIVANARKVRGFKDK